MQKFKTSATPAEISYHQVVQGFINPLKCAYHSINGFSIDHVIFWSTARTQLRAVALRAICDGRSVEKFGERAREKFDGRRNLRNDEKVRKKTNRTIVISLKKMCLPRRRFNTTIKQARGVFSPQ